MPRGRARGRGRGSGRGSSRGGRRSGGSTQLLRTPKQRGKGRGRTRVTTARSITRPPPPSRRKPWEDSGSEDDERGPDFYSDVDSDKDSFASSDSEQDELDFVVPLKKPRETPAAPVPGLEVEADDDDDDESGDDDLDGDFDILDDINEQGSTDDDEEFIVSCPWINPSQDQPILQLPPSSQDLLIDKEYLFDALEVYEVCRRYSSTLKISPILFEDFCAALISVEQPKILAEIHVQLLRLILKEEEQEEVVFGPMDQRDCQNVTFHLLDVMTYAEILRQYLESDISRFPTDVIEIVSKNYPFVSVSQRLTVLKWLCEKFLQSDAFRQELKTEGIVTHDEHCRDCGKPGQLLCCDGCSAAYHLQCVEPKLKEVPQTQWFCCICQVHQTKGIYDCISPLEKAGQLIRHETLGYDRHGRRYWFLARRIIIQNDSTNDLWYYSTCHQLRQLVAKLDEKELEWRLCSLLHDHLTDICRQMKITTELTEARKGTKSYLTVQNDQIWEELRSEKKEVGLNNEPNESRTLFSRLDEILGIKGLTHIAVSRCDGDKNDGEPPKLTAAVPNHVGTSKKTYATPLKKVEQRLYKLGMDSKMGYRRYNNQYSSNDYAKTPYARAQERTRQNYMANRFSLQDEGEFNWPTPPSQGNQNNANAPIIDAYSDEKSVAKLLANCLQKLQQRIPVVMMHRQWPKEGATAFRRALEMANAPLALAEELALLECCMRRPLLSSTWRDSLGHVRLVRQTAEDREQRQKIEKKKKAHNHSLLSADPNDEESNIVWVKYAKLDGPPKHQVWKLKDEQYRVNGFNNLGGWIWISCNRRLRIQTPQPSQKTDSKFSELYKKKQKRIDGLTQTFRDKREEQCRTDKRNRQRDVQKECYSPSCRMGFSNVPVSGPTSIAQSCYSCGCRQNTTATENPLPMDTQTIVKIFPPSKFRKEHEIGLGREKPYPLPNPQRFDGKKRPSILVLPKNRLHRLARQGGLKDRPITGFSAIAKGNQTIWQYPSPRPLFQTCWRYMLQTAHSFHAVALLFRILYANIRWADLEEDAPKDGLLEIARDEYTEEREVVEHLELGPYGLSAKYRFFAIMTPFEEILEAQDKYDKQDPGYRSSGRTPRSGNGRNLRQTPSTTKKSTPAIVEHKPAYTKVTEQYYWAVENELKLWEILLYWTNYQKNQAISKAQIVKKPLTPVQPTAVITTARAINTINEKRTIMLSTVKTSGVLAAVRTSTVTAAVKTTPILSTGKTRILTTPIISAGKTPIVTTIKTPGMRVTPHVNKPANAGTLTGRVLHERPSAGPRPRPVLPKPLKRTPVGSPAVMVVGNQIGYDSRPINVMKSPGDDRDFERPPSVGYEHDHFHYTQSRPPSSIRQVPMQGPRPPLRIVSKSGQGPPPGRYIVTPSGRLQPAEDFVRPGPGVRILKVGGASQNSMVFNMSPGVGSISGNVQMLPNQRGRPVLYKTIPGNAEYKIMKPNELSSVSPPILEAEPDNQRMGAGRRMVLKPRTSGLEAPPISIMKSPETFDIRARGAAGDRRPGTNINPDFMHQPINNTRYSYEKDTIQQLDDHQHYGLNVDDNEEIDVESYDDGVVDINPQPVLVSSNLNSLKPLKVQSTTIHRKPSGYGPRDHRIEPRRVSDEANVPISPLSPSQKRAMYFDQQNKRIIEPTPVLKVKTIKRPYGDINEQKVPPKLKVRVKEKVYLDVAKAQKTKQEREEDRRRTDSCRRLLNDVLKEVEKREKSQLKRDYREYRREYDRVYRKKKKLEKQWDVAMGERIIHVKKEIQKRRALMEQRAQREALVFIDDLRKPKQSTADSLPIRYGGKRPLSERLMGGSPSVGQHVEDSPPSKKFKPQLNPSTWQPPKATATLAADKSGNAKTHKSLPVINPMDSPPKSMINKKQLHCICKTKYDPTRFYVGCDLCSRWFHGKCVGISAKQSKRLDSFVCHDCSKEKHESQEELYCVCRMPYDESQFYVGCDGCEGWYHPRCVGITIEDAEAMSEYICPNCPSTEGIQVGTLTLSREDYPRLWRLFESLQEHRTSWPFREPVDRSKYPTYYSVIKHPMDLKTVQRRLESLEYERLQEFVTDISRIFDNARLFNPKDSPIYQCAVILEKRFRENLQSVKDEISQKADIQESLEEPQILAITDDSLDQIQGQLLNEPIVVVDDDFDGQVLQPEVGYQVDI